MNAKKQERLLSNQTATALKVWECIPIQETWAVKQINAELIRRGISLQGNILLGCLKKLREDGLIRELRGSYGRVHISTPVTPFDALDIPTFVPEKEAPAMKKEPITLRPKAKEPATPVDLLGAKTAALRAKAAALRDDATVLEQLADDIDTAVLDMQAQAEQKQSEYAELDQLRSLLKKVI